MENFSPIKYKDADIATTYSDGELWFSIRDVAEAIGYAPATVKSISALVHKYVSDNNQKRMAYDNQKRMTYTNKIIFVNEQGLVEFVNRSFAPDVNNFKKWLFDNHFFQDKRNETFASETSANEENDNIVSDDNIVNSIVGVVSENDSEKATDVIVCGDHDAKDFQIFQSDIFGKINVLLLENEVWFIGLEVAKALGYYTNPNAALREFCKHTKTLEYINSEGVKYGPGVLIIPESDLYRLIIHSTKSNAEAFQDWIVEEVLPSLRKGGKYALPMKQGNNLPCLAPDLSAINQEIKILDRQLESLNCTPITRLLAADNIYRNKLGVGLIASMDSHVRKLVFCEYITPTEIGEFLEPEMKPEEVNKLLSKYRFQKWNKKKEEWEPKCMGHKYAAVFHLNKYHSDGRPIVQLKWHHDIVDELQEILDNA